MIKMPGDVWCRLSSWLGDDHLLVVSSVLIWRERELSLWSLRGVMVSIYELGGVTQFYP